MNSGKAKRESAFSLVEVTIAMAIAAVALVTLMGMIPQGMNTMRDAGDTAIQARIHQQILNELQMANYQDLDTEYDDLVLFYDAQGEELGDDKTGYPSGESGFNHVYSARIILPQKGASLPQSVGSGSYDGMSFDRGATENSEIRPVLIEVAVVGGQANQFDWDSQTNQNLISTYQTSLVKMQKIR